MPHAASVRDPEAFEALYRAHARYVAGVVHRLLSRGGGDGELVTVAVRRTRRILARRRRRALFGFFAKDYAPRASDPRDRSPVDDLYDALLRRASAPVDPPGEPAFAQAQLQGDGGYARD